eukprot:c16807_g1_i1 orf=507-3563(-)
MEMRFPCPLSLLFCSLLFQLVANTWHSPGPASAANTDPGEVTSLKSIANKMNFTQWDFSMDPCAWTNSGTSPYIKCTCTNSTCHVTTLYVATLNLVGGIPLEIMNFTQLQLLNMGYNLFSGPIPAQLGTLTQLQNIDFGINQLSGSLPPVFGNLTNLVTLGIGSNYLSGTFPKELGQLESLTGLYMDVSGLSGQLPVEFGRLTNLQYIWMFGTPFSGQIPDVFGNMSNLREVKIYGNNFTGPIPASLVSWTSIEILIIGDVSNGGTIPSSFKALTIVGYLSLRNNGLSGSIPEDLGTLSSLLVLDLSFNNLSGRIPDSFSSMISLTKLFLGNNNLQGNISMLAKTQSLQNLDVSNNRLSGPLSTWVTSSSLEANLLWNFFEQNDPKTRLVSATFNCLDKNIPCDRTAQGEKGLFAINCGGPEFLEASTQTTYSADDEILGNSSYFQRDGNVWGVSNTGYIIDSKFATTLSTTSTIQGTSNQELYKTARCAADSLRYYGVDLVNGLYTVELHFAEIAIPANGTWQGTGRRIFDIYIQGFRVLRDFNIRSEANGSFIAVVKNFTANVTDQVLEIHLFWSGKGTCCSPSRWTYGPLISAIRVVANFYVPIPASSSKQKVLVIVAPIVAGVLICFMIICLIYRRNRIKRVFRTPAPERPGDLTSMEFFSMEAKPHMFTYNELKLSTEDFHMKNKLGEGGFGAVFKGHLSDGTVVAVKQLTGKTDKGKQDFMNEVATISSVQHRNLVKLLGCCIEENRKLLVFEFLENNSLYHTLLCKRLFLDWPTRFNICLGIAKGLSYLHEESRTRIVHRDIKASNILLDEHLNPKIADFGLAKLFKDDKTHVSTRVAGTIGYLAPEYALRGKLTEKADVYSFGILLLEIVSGRSNTDTSLPDEMVYLLEWTWQLYEEKRLLDLVDESLEGNFLKEDVERVIHVALLCMQAVATARPKMSDALSMLMGSMEITLSVSRPGFLSDLKQFAKESMESSYTGTTSTANTTTASSHSVRPVYSIADQTISLVEPR